MSAVLELNKEKEIVDKFLGIPFRHHGRSPAGLDCYGLIIAVYKELGYEVWDIEEEYDRNWSFKGRNHFIENYHKEWVKVDEPAVFDVVLFSNRRGVANHGGVVLSRGRFMHACRAGVVISRLGDINYWRRIEGFYRLKKRILG